MDERSQNEKDISPSKKKGEEERKMALEICNANSFH
jgi:hypothetical protein